MENQNLIHIESGLVVNENKPVIKECKQCKSSYEVDPIQADWGYCPSCTYKIVKAFYTKAPPNMTVKEFREHIEDFI